MASTRAETMKTFYNNMKESASERMAQYRNNLHAVVDMYKMSRLYEEVRHSYIGPASLKTLLIIVLSIGGVTMLFRFKSWLRTRHILSIKREDKRRKCRQAIENLRSRLENSRVSESKQAEIRAMSLEDLVDSLQTDKVTALEVLHAYQKKALDSHAKTNCLIEPITEAEVEAAQRDLSDKKEGPLHGVPISIKDNFGLKGYDCTNGLSQWIDQPLPEDCVLVQVLKKQGAIPFVKTNVPQTLLSWDTTNPIFGSTSHPLKAGRCVGGSSGGEAALMADGGSILGLGGDIGGSIRIPCHMCGVCGFKPTSGRMSNRGSLSILKGQNGIVAVYGPITRDVESLVLFMRSVMVPYMWQLDSAVIPIPFRDEMYTEKRKLRIGYFSNLDILEAVPACKRAVGLAKDALLSAGYELVPWEYENLDESTAYYWSSMMFGDGGRRFLDSIYGDKISHAIPLAYYLHLPNVIQKLLTFIIKLIRPKISVLSRSGQGAGSVAKYWDIVKSLDEFRNEVTDDLKKKKVPTATLR